MNTTEILDKAIALAADAAPSLSARLNVLRRQTDKSLMKVCVLGDFKAGKSTLINRLFLRRPLLPTEFSECTAVPTHVMNGPERLCLMKREADGTETLVEDILNPEPAKIAACITAKDETARADMAKQYSRAILTMPDILPDGICLVDTPGLNSTNTDIVTGTMLEAHEADAVLYVHHRTQLSTREEKLIRSLSGSQNPKLPFFILITHDSTQSDLTVAEICQEVKSSLALSYIEVQCAAFNRDDNQEGKVTMAFGTLSAFKPAAEKRSGFGSFGSFGSFGTQAPVTQVSPAPQAAQPLAEQLTHFFETSVAQGRIAKIRRELLPMLQELRGTLSGRLALCESDERKIAHLENELRVKKQEYEREIEDVLADFRMAQLTFKGRVQQKIKEIGRAKKQTISALKELSDVQSELSSWQETVPADISQAIEMLQIDLNRELREIAYQHSCRLSNKFRPNEQLPVSFDPGFLAKIPSWLTLTCDYLLVCVLSPMAFFIDLPLRYLFKDLPIFPANIMKKMAISIALAELDKVLNQVSQDVEENLNQQFSNLNDEMRTALLGNGNFADLEQALKDARQGVLDAAAKENLQTRSAETDAMLHLLEA